MQRRSLKKRIGPGQWDLSVAEHLAVGEGFADGARRGLGEELGLPPAAAGGIVGPLAPTHLRRLDLPALGVKDYEFVQSYRLDGYDGPVAPNPEEVSATEHVALPALRARMAAAPDDFTPWFRDEINLLGFFGAPAAAPGPEGA
jgi:isopentenyl-diphosphate delta-isomerase